MSDDEHYTQFDNNLDVDDGSNARGTTYPPETEDEILHVVEGDDGFMFVERKNKGLPAKPEAESTIKQFFPPLSILPGDGERHTVVTTGRPKGITDFSQLCNQPNETFQVEQTKQRAQEARHPTHSNNTEMTEYVTDGSGNIQMHGIASHEPMEILDEYVEVASEIRDQSMTHMDQLGHENEMLKTLLSDLHKYVTSHSVINDSPFERAMKPDPPVDNLYRQAQDIYHFLKTTKEIERETASSSKQLLELLSLITGDGEHHKTIETEGKGRTRDVSQSLLEQSDRQKKSFQHALSVLEQINQRQQHMDRLGNENEILKTLLSDLHKYVTSYMEINDSPFELSSAFRPDPPVANSYKQAQDVYHFLKEAKEMESETASVSKQLLELLSIIIGDGEHHKTCSTGRERGTKDVSLSLLQQSDRQKERFKRALYVLEQMKETQKHMDRLENENESLKTLLSDLHKYVTSHTEINDSPFELSSAIEPDPPVANLFRQSQDVYQFLKETRERARHMDRLGNENEILKTLLSDLHKYVTSYMEINDSPFELSSAFRPDPPVANLYKQAQDVYHFLKEAKKIESETASVSKQLLELLSIIIGDGEHHKTCSTGRERGTKDVSLSLLQQSDRQKERFKRALYVLEQMKETQKANTVIKDEKIAKKKPKELLKIIEGKEKQINRLKEENATDKENLKIQQDLTKFIDAKWTTDRELLQSSFAKQEIAKTKMAQLQEAFDGEVSKSQFLTKQLYDLQRERDELLKRLSRLAGDMLKHENTNLTDLNDVDRLMKLSKAYSELYDNEWTDAFEELTGRGLKDNDAVAKLLDMLMVTYHKCGQITWERYRTLKSVVSTIDIVHVHPSVVAYSDTEVQGYDETLPPSDGQATKVRNGREEYLVLKVNNPNVYTNHATKETEPVYNRNKDVGCSPQTNEEHLTSQMTLSIEQEREIKDIWRTRTKAIKQDAVKHLYTVLLTRFDTPIKDLVSTSKYLTSCIDLCWKMGVQEKPMYLDIVAEKNGGSGLIFDLDKFRAYTMSGERVDFVVWPALFLHDGGQILVKGIAQGCNKSGS